MSSEIKRNKDGKRNLLSLRAALNREAKVDVQSQGGQWIISRYSPVHGCFIQSPSPYWHDERQAIESAIGIEEETPPPGYMG